jgi:GNAT acetyltransferase-like protein
MLHGQHITLRPIRGGDVDELYGHHIEIANRGEYFPISVMSESEFKKEFAESGSGTRTRACSSCWMRSTGSSATSNPFGRCRTGTPTSCLPAERPGRRRAGLHDRGRSASFDYLFDTKPRHRIHLVVLPDNGASRRIAEKCGFTLEGTIREPFTIAAGTWMS